nr:hypothetical protein CFP56_13229 [Quercus suber]
MTAATYRQSPSELAWVKGMPPYAARWLRWAATQKAYIRNVHPPPGHCHIRMGRNHTPDELMTDGQLAKNRDGSSALETLRIQTCSEDEMTPSDCATQTHADLYNNELDSGFAMLLHGRARILTLCQSIKSCCSNSVIECPSSGMLDARLTT